MNNYRLLSRLSIAVVVAALIVAVIAVVIVVPGRAKFWRVRPQQSFEANTLKSTDPPPGVPSSQGVRTICFVREHFVQLFEPATGVTRKIIAGEGCNISPDGNAIAVTVDRDEPGKIGYPKNIKIVDLKSQTLKDLDFISPSTKGNPQWSPDGRSVAFQLAVHNQGHVAVLNVNTSEWQDITRNLDLLEPGGAVNTYGVDLDSWVTDGKSILCQDLNFIYEIAIDGKLLQKIRIDSIADRREVEISGNMRFSYSRDRNFIAFYGNSEPRTSQTNLAVYIFEVKARKLSRITPEGIDASEPIWLPSGREIMFQRLQKREDSKAVWDICMISIENGSVTTLVKNSSAASYSFD